MCVRLFSLIIFFLPGFIQSQNSNRADPLKQQTYLNQNSDNALLMEKKRNECLHLTTTYTNKGNKDSAIYFMEQALIYGYSDLDEILNLCFIIPKSIKKEVYFRLVHTSDINFIKQHIADSLLDIKLLCRFVYFNDQFTRIYSQMFEAKCIQQADSINQMKIIALLSDERINSVKYDIWVSNALNIVFLHAAEKNFAFFENNFYKYVSLYNNDFVVFTNVAYVFDFYLYYKYRKRFFTSDKKPDENGKLILHPKLSIEELNAVLNMCNIHDLVY